MTAIGRLIKKTQRHDACSTSHPPRTGPMAAVIAVKPDQVPMARPRSLLCIRGADNGQTSRNQERRSYPLKSACDDEGSD